MEMAKRFQRRAGVGVDVVAGRVYSLFSWWAVRTEEFGVQNPRMCAYISSAFDGLHSYEWWGGGVGVAAGRVYSLFSWWAVRTHPLEADRIFSGESAAQGWLQYVWDAPRHRLPGRNFRCTVSQIFSCDASVFQFSE